MEDEIKLSLNAEGVKTGVSAAKKSIDDLGQAVEGAGRRGKKGFEDLSKGASGSAQEMDRTTRNFVSSLQRQIAAAEAGSTSTRQYQESIARLRGANMDVLKPYLDQLDAAKVKTDQAKVSMEGITGAARSMGNYLGIAVGLLSTFSLGTFISETAQAEQEQAQLGAVLRSTGESAGWSREQLNKLADQMANKSIFSAGDITEAQTRLLAYTGVVGKQFPEALQAATDMATRMGMTVSSAAEQIGRALDVPSQGLNALSRQGFRFTEDQKKLVEQLEATGKVAEAQAIVLEALETSYGGAAEAARESFGGAIADLKNSIQDLMTGGEGSVSVMKTGVEALTQVIKDASVILGAMESDNKELAGSFNLVSIAQEGFAILLETISVLGVNTAYVLTSVGREIGAIAAQASLLLEWNWDGIAAVRKAAVADAEAARREVDATTDRILNARKKLREDAAKPEESLSPDRAIRAAANVPAAKSKEAEAAAKKAEEAAKKARKEFDALFESLQAKDMGLDAKYLDQLDSLYTGWQKGWISVNDYIEAVGRLINQQPFAKEALKQQQEAYEALIKTIDDASKVSAQQEKSAKEMLEAIKFETRLMGLNNNERRVAVLLRDMEKSGIVAGTEAYKEYADQLKEALKNNIAVTEATETHKKAQQESIDMWKSIDSTAHDVFTNVFEDGAGTFKRLKQTAQATFLDWLYQMTVKRWIINIGANFTGTSVADFAQLLTGSGGGGGGGILGMANNASSIYSAASGSSTVGSMVFGNSFAYGAATPGLSVGGQQAAMLAAQTGEFGYAGLSATAQAGGGAAGAGGLGTGIGAAGVMFGAILLGGMLAAYLDKGDTFSGAAYATSKGDDPYTQVNLGEVNPDMDSGNRPDREAIKKRLREMGAPESSMEGLNDRALHRMMILGETTERQSGGDPTSGGLMNWNEWSKVNKDLPDFYQGQGYASPEGLGWWEQQDMGSGDRHRPWDSFFSDPAVTAASRKLAEGLLEPIKYYSELFGNDSDFKVATGMAWNDKTGKITGGLQVWENDESKLNWGARDFENTDEYLRANFHDTLGLLEGMDGIPEWMKKQIDGVQDEINKLEGENIGDRAGQAFANATTLMAQVYEQIELLVKTIPDLAGASQDAVFSIGEAFGGLDKYLASYSSYIQNYYTEDERKDFTRKNINENLSRVGLSVDENTSRADYRQMVEDAAKDKETEEGRARYVALLQSEQAFASITPAAEEASEAVSRLADLLAEQDELWITWLDTIGETAEAEKLRRERAIKGMTEEEAAQYDSNRALEQRIEKEKEFQTVISGISGSLSSVLTDGLLGNLTGEDLGGKMADVVIGGVYNALASNAAQQITDMMMATVIGPLVKASIAGTLTAETVSRAAIDNMVANAKAVITALGTVFNDPVFKEFMAELDTMLKNIMGDAPTVPYYTNYQPTATPSSSGSSMDWGNEAADAARKAAADAARAAQDAAFNSLQRAIQAEKERVQTALEAAQVLEESARTVFDYLGGQLKELYGQVDSTAEMQAREGQLFLEQALNQLRVTGEIPDQEKLSDAVKALRDQLSEGNFSSQLDQDFARLVLAGQLEELKEGAEDQLTEAEEQIAILEETLVKWDDSLELAQLQLDKLQGIDNTILSVAEAVKLWRPYGNLGQLPSYDVGTPFVPQDQIAKVHKGERIFTATENVALMEILRGDSRGSQEAVVSAINQLRSDNRIQAAEIVRLQSLVAKMLDKWDGDGLPKEREGETP